MEDKYLRETAESLSSLIPAMGHRLLKRMELKNKNILTPMQVNALHILNESSGYTMSALSDRMQVSNSQMTVAVNTLVERKLIERIHDEKDRRVIKARITNNGKKQLKRYNDGIVESIMKQLRILDEEECKKLNRAAQDFLEILGKINESDI